MFKCIFDKMIETLNGMWKDIEIDDPHNNEDQYFKELDKIGRETGIYSFWIPKSQWLYIGKAETGIVGRLKRHFKDSNDSSFSDSFNQNLLNTSGIRYKQFWSFLKENYPRIGMRVRYLSIKEQRLIPTIEAALIGEYHPVLNSLTKLRITKLKNTWLKDRCSFQCKVKTELNLIKQNSQ